VVALEIRLFGDPALKSRAAEVTEFDASLKRLSEHMLETLRADEGRAAIAANQVGRLKRLFVAEMEDERYVVVNPVVEQKTEEKETDIECCLSIPGIGVEVERHEGAVVLGRDAEGRPVRFEVNGAIARMMQHEIDHLDGILTLDRTDRESRRRALRQWRDRLLAQS
jgi:peptide deformylase